MSPFALPAAEAARVSVRLLVAGTVGPAPRGVLFRRLPAGWGSDALVAVRYGSGRTVYPQPIVLPADPRSRLVGGELPIDDRAFEPYMGAPARVLGWVRRHPGDHEAIAATASRHLGRDWASELAGISTPTPTLFGPRQIGRFTIRAVPPGGTLYSGLTRGYDRTPSNSERDHAIIEVYDTRYAGQPGFASLGQFVSSYRAETLAKGEYRRLSLHGDTPAWTMSEPETAELLALARAVVGG